MFAVLGLIMSLIQGGYIRRQMAGREIAMAKRAILCLIAGFISVGFSSSKYSLYFGLLPFGTDFKDLFDEEFVSELF